MLVRSQGVTPRSGLGEVAARVKVIVHRWAARGPKKSRQAPKHQKFTVYYCLSHAYALYGSKSLNEMGKAQKKTGKGRLDKYYKLAKYGRTSSSGYKPLTIIHLQRTRVSCTFCVQADPAEQEIHLLGICAMLHRLMRRTRGMAPGCKQGNAREQSDRWYAESLHYHNCGSLIHLLKKSVPQQALTW